MRMCVCVWWLDGLHSTTHDEMCKEAMANPCMPLLAQRYLSLFNEKISGIFSFVFLFCVLVSAYSRRSNGAQQQRLTTTAADYGGSKICQMN